MKPAEITNLIASLTGPVKKNLDDAYQSEWDVRDAIHRETQRYEAAGKALRGEIIGRLYRKFRGRLAGGKSWREHGWYVRVEVSDMCYLVCHDKRPRYARPAFAVTVTVCVKDFPVQMKFDAYGFMPRDFADVEALAARLRAAAEGYVHVLWTQQTVLERLP